MLTSLNKKISTLRKANNMTQAELARRLNVSRACIALWENEAIKPSTDYIIEVGKLFHVSTDYLLGLNYNVTIDVEGLSPDDVSLLLTIADRLRKN